MSSPLLEATGLCKNYGRVAANEDVSLRVYSGSVRALVGENGAGKSTLVGMLFGLIRPDGGRIHCKGQAVQWSHPGQALAAGVGLVQQHVTLVSDLTVTENVLLGCEPRRGLFTDRAAARRQVASLRDRYGLSLDPDVRVDRLSVGEQQQVEIAKVLARGVEVLMLDEPTAVLAPTEIESLLRLLRELANQGIGIVFISHKLPEVQSVADGVTVLRHGRVVWDGLMADTDTERLAQAMIGERVPTATTSARRKPGGEVLRIEGLVAEDERQRRLGPLNLTVHEGEILGVAGVAGSGQELLLDILLGHRDASQGTATFDDHDVLALRPERRLALGFGYVPQDRGARAVIPETPLSDHLLVRRAGRETSSWGWVDPSCLNAETQNCLGDYQIAADGPEASLDTLSGGHQQRSVLAFELARGPRLLLLHDPTRGLDVRAAQDVRSRLCAVAEEGVSLLLVSSDLSELLSLSDRIIVLYQGRIAGELLAEDANMRTLGRMMTGLESPDRPRPE